MNDDITNQDLIKHIKEIEEFTGKQLKDITDQDGIDWMIRKGLERNIKVPVLSQSVNP